MFIKREGKQSEWRWNTSRSMSQSAEVVGGTIGNFILFAPWGGTASFNYVSLGVGLSFGGSLGPVISTKDMMSEGDIFISDSFSGELSSSDFQGYCVITEASAIAKQGRSGALMLLGIPAADVPRSLLTDVGIGAVLSVAGADGRSLIDRHPILTLAAGVSPYFATVAGEHFSKNHGAAVPDSVKSKAKVALITYGENGGIAAGVGISASLGYVWIGESDDPPAFIKKLLLPVPVDHYDRIVATTREKIPFPSDVLFDFDKWNIKPDAELALWGLAHEIQQRTPAHIIIEGHTDAIGDAGYNLKLSQWRAEAVVSWLVVRRIVKLANITPKGYGHQYPAFDDTVKGQDNSVARMRNRRIEVRFLWG